MKAMILAAGRGNRMRPLTDVCPKPLLEVAHKPLIFWHLDKLAALGVTEVVINTAWLAAKLVQAIGQGEAFGLKVLWSHEPEGGLETAGGIIQALPLLGTEPFYLVNGDIWFDYDFSNLPTQLLGVGHLVLVDNPEHHLKGDFAINDLGYILPSNSSQVAQLKTYSGLAVLSADLFTLSEEQSLKENKISQLKGQRLPLRPFFEQAAQAGVLTAEYSSSFWTDVGTPQRLEELNKKLLERYA